MNAPTDQHVIQVLTRANRTIKTLLDGNRALGAAVRGLRRVAFAHPVCAADVDAILIEIEHEMGIASE